VNRLRRLWIRLTYWRVPCEDCDGTGICRQNKSTHPHSCCGDCERKTVPLAAVPEGFLSETDRKLGRAIIGDGIMWRRPWSKRQVRKPVVR